MTKIVQAKYKIDRRLGCNLHGRRKSPYNIRQTRPGANGKAPRKLSPFGEQLCAKQRLKGYYANIQEKQFRKYYKEADRLTGDTSENLIQLLERRLDAVVYRMMFVPTPYAARQLISHGHVRVNGQKVTIGSYSVKDGDVVTLTDKGKQIPMVLEAIESAERDHPEYVSVDTNKFEGTYLRGPKFDEVPYPVKMEPNLVIEFYSR